MNYTKQQDKAYNELKKRLVTYMMSVQRIYDNISAQASSIALSTDYDADSGEVFSFKNYPEQRTAIEKMQKDFVSELSSLVDNGITKEWENSNMAQNLLVNSMFESIGVKANNFRDKKYFQLNEGALRAFKTRKDRGMGISSKIWSQSKELQDELADAISVSIQRGMSAITLSKRISKYLSNFQELKRDYGEKFGTAIRTKDCQYHSIRLARTEINMAYRNAEQARWQQFDFVLGYRIKLSNNHTCKGVMNFYDICDDLAGDYPKDFKWAGWHPSCRCYAVPILMSEDDFDRYNLGEPTKEKPITEMPKQFDEWLMRNADRIEKAQERGTLPYFLRDNKQLILFVKNKDLISKSNLDTVLHDSKIFGVGVSPLYKELNRKGATKDSVMDVALDLYDKTRNSPLRIAYDDAYDEYKKVISATLGSNFNGTEYNFEALNSEKDVLSKIEALKQKTKTFTTAKERHSKRTPEDIRKIQVAWNKKKLNDYFYPEKNPLDIDFIEQLDCKLIFVKDNSISCFSPSTNTIKISLTDRQLKSKFYKTKVIYHEGGHYIDKKYSIKTNKKLIEIFSKHKKAIEEGWTTTYYWKEKRTLRTSTYINDKLWDYNHRIIQLSEDYSRYNLSKTDISEALLSIADTVASLTEGNYGWGHPKEYFSKQNNPIAEFIAHAFELRYQENRLFRKMMPELYDDLTKFLKDFKFTS